MTVNGGTVNRGDSFWWAEITRLPWVGHRARRWEVEPLRWLAVQGIYAAYRAADRAEASGRSARTSRFAHLADLISGR